MIQALKTIFSRAMWFEKMSTVSRSLEQGNNCVNGGRTVVSSNGSIYYTNKH